MKITDRQLRIDGLLSMLGIPQTVTHHHPRIGVGPCDTDYFQRYEADRRVQEIGATAALHAMSDDEISRLPTSQERLSTFLYNFFLEDAPQWYAGGFSVAGFEPDWNKWRLMDYWDLQEATCLSIGFTPQRINRASAFNRNESAPVRFFFDRMEIIGRSDCFDQAGQKLQPQHLVDWMVKKKIPAPPGMLEALPVQERKSTKPLDTRLHDSTLKLVLGLLAGFYGDLSDECLEQAPADIHRGLLKIGISLDRKTVKARLAEAISSLPRYVDEQAKRDA